MDLKVCKKCLKSLPMKDFYTRSDNKASRGSCRKCHILDVTLRYQERRWANAQAGTLRPPGKPKTKSENIHPLIEKIRQASTRNKSPDASNSNGNGPRIENNGGGSTFSHFGVK